MSEKFTQGNPDSRHMSTQQGLVSGPRPTLGRSDTEQLLSYYQSPLADSNYNSSEATDTRRPTAHRQLSSTSTSESDYSDSSHSDYTAQKRTSIPSEGGSDRRRMAIVEMDTLVETAKRHNSLRARRGKDGSFGSLALVAPPDASPKSYTGLSSSPSAAPTEGKHYVESPTRDDMHLHHRSHSEAVSPTKSPRNVGIIGTARQPIILDLESVDEGGKTLRPPIFIHPQSRSPSPATSQTSLPPMKRRSTGQSITVVTPEIGSGKPIDAPVASPIVVDLHPRDVPRAAHDSPKPPPHVPSSYLDYKPGIHATAGPLPPPPALPTLPPARAAFPIDTQLSPPPRPPRLNSPAQTGPTSQFPKKRSIHSLNTPSTRRGEIDVMRQALQLPASVAKALAARPISPNMNDNPNSSASSLSSQIPPEIPRSVHRREGAFSPSEGTSPQSVTINVTETETEPDSTVIPPSLRRVDQHLHHTHEEVLEMGPPITEVHPLKPPTAFAAYSVSAGSSSSSFGTVQPLTPGEMRAGGSVLNALLEDTWVDVHPVASSASTSPTSPRGSIEHQRNSAEHSHHARTIASQSTSTPLSVDDHATGASASPSGSSSASPVLSRSHSPSRPSPSVSRSSSLSPAPSPPPKSFRHSITTGLRRMSISRSPSARSLGRGSYERERNSHEDDASVNLLPNIPQAQPIDFQTPAYAPLREIQPQQQVVRPYIKPLQPKQPLRRQPKIDSNPAAMFCSEVTGKRNASERCLLYAQKINELWAHDCGLGEWMNDFRVRGSGSGDRRAAVSLIQPPPAISPTSSTFAPSSPPTIPFTTQPRQTSQSSHTSIRTEVTFPRRPDASTATDLLITPKEAMNMNPPTGPPPLPYPSLVSANPRPPGRSSTYAGNSSGTESSPSKGYRALSPLTPTSKTGAFFASLGRKASVTRKDKGLGSAGLSLGGASSAASRLSKLPPKINSQNLPPPNTTPVTAPSVPGGPRAAPHRMLRSQTMMVSPMPSPSDSSGPSSAGRSNAIGRGPSLYNIPSADSVHHSTPTYKGYLSSTGVRGGPRSKSSSPSKSPTKGHHSPTQPEPSWDPEFRRQVDKLSDLMPHADRGVLAGYLRRAGQDILAIGQYLEDEKNGCLRRD